MIGIEYYKKASSYEVSGQLGLALTYYRKAYKLNPELDQDLDQLTLEESTPEPESRTSRPDSALSHVPSRLSVTEPRAKRSNGNLTCLPPELMLRIFELALLSSSLISLVGLSVLNSYYHGLLHDACLWKAIYIALTRPSQRSDLSACTERGDALLQEELYTFYEKERPALAQNASPISRTDAKSPQHDYLRMVQWLPRVRSQGLYICRLVYTRPGQTEGAFNQPIHIVTYYRYLYFHPQTRQVTLLLSNDEPATAVPLFVSYLLQHPAGPASRSHSQDKAMPFGKPMDRSASQAPGQLTTGHYLQEGSELFISIAPSLKPAPFSKTDLSKRQVSLFLIRLRILNYSVATKHLYHDGAKLQWMSFAEKNMETNDMVAFDLSIFKSFIYSPVKALYDA